MVSSCLCPYFLAGVFCDNLNQCDGATVDLFGWGASLSRSHFVWRLSQFSLSLAFVLAPKHSAHRSPDCSGLLFAVCFSVRSYVRFVACLSAEGLASGGALSTPLIVSDVRFVACLSAEVLASGGAISTPLIVSSVSFSTCLSVWGSSLDW
jgi:hypothetical protein